MRQKLSLTVLHGGKFVRVPKALAIGTGTRGFTVSERDAIARAAVAGFKIVVFTELYGRQAAKEFDGVDGVSIAVPRDSRLMPGPPLTRRAARVEALTRVLQGWGMGLEDVVAVGTSPIDRDLLMAAGAPIALEGAGYDALAVAGLRFSAREADGLVRAIDAACTLVPNCRVPTTRPHDRG